MSTTITAPKITTSGGSLKIPANALRYNTSSSKDAPHWSTTAEALSNAQSQIDALTKFANALSAFVVSSSTGGFPATGLNFLTVVSGNVAIDLSLGDVQYLVLPASAPTVLPPIYSGRAMFAGMRFTLIMVEDNTGNNPFAVIRWRGWRICVLDPIADSNRWDRKHMHHR